MATPSPSVNPFPRSDSRPELTVTDVETLLRDAHALATALAELSEDARTSDGPSIVRLVKPKLAAARRPLERWEGTISGRAKAEGLGLRRLYDEAKSIVDAEDEADTCVFFSFFSLFLDIHTY